MNLSAPTIENTCPREEVSLYLDGELSPKEEIILEKHLAECETCLAELNFQKQMLSALDFAFDKREEIELPEEFTKIIVTKAESGVKGLRCRKERWQAALLCFGLFLFLAVGFSGESGAIFKTVGNLGNQVLTVGSFIVHLTYDISLGIAVILRSLSQKIVFSTGFTVLFIGCAVALFIISLPRFVYRLSRAKTS